MRKFLICHHPHYDDSTLVEWSPPSVRIVARTIGGNWLSSHREMSEGRYFFEVIDHIGYSSEEISEGEADLVRFEAK